MDCTGTFGIGLNMRQRCVSHQTALTLQCKQAHLSIAWMKLAGLLSLSAVHKASLILLKSLDFGRAVSWAGEAGNEDCKPCLGIPNIVYSELN